LAWAAIGRPAVAVERYRLRGGRVVTFDGWMRGAGFAPVAAEAQALPGDLLLCQVSPGQFHLMITGHRGLVHAHAGLGRVVLAPPPAPWPVVRRWRWAGQPGKGIG